MAKEIDKEEVVKQQKSVNQAMLAVMELRYLSSRVIKAIDRIAAAGLKKGAMKVAATTMRNQLNIFERNIQKSIDREEPVYSSIKKNQEEFDSIMEDIYQMVVIKDVGQLKKVIRHLKDGKEVMLVEESDES
jgi:hypothetical protein